MCTPCCLLQLTNFLIWVSDGFFAEQERLRHRREQPAILQKQFHVMLQLWGTPTYNYGRHEELLFQILSFLYNCPFCISVSRKVQWHTTAIQYIWSFHLQNHVNIGIAISQGGQSPHIGGLLTSGSVRVWLGLYRFENRMPALFSLTWCLNEAWSMILPAAMHYCIHLATEEACEDRLTAL